MFLYQNLEKKIFCFYFPCVSFIVHFNSVQRVLSGNFSQYDLYIDIDDMRPSSCSIDDVCGKSNSIRFVSKNGNVTDLYSFRTAKSSSNKRARL